MTLLLLLLAAAVPAAAAGLASTVYMCGASGLSAQTQPPFDVFVGDVVTVLSQAAPLYAARSSCYFTFRAASGSGCGLNVKALSYQMENPFDFLYTYNYSAPAPGDHIEQNFFAWNSFVPALTGSFNYPPVAGVAPAYSLDVAAGADSWVSLVFKSDASGNFAGVQRIVVSATACVAGATATRTSTATSVPSASFTPSASPSSTPSVLPTPQGMTKSLVMCDASGQSTRPQGAPATGDLPPYDLFFGDVYQISSQTAPSYADNSNCVATFRAAPAGCGLNVKIFNYELEDETDFLDVYNFTAPVSNTPLITNFFPWNEFLPRVTGKYRTGSAGSGGLQVANYSLNVPAGSWVSLVFFSDASNTGAGLQSAVVSTVQCAPGATPTRTAAPSVSATPSPSPRASINMCGSAGNSQFGGAVYMAPGSSLALRSQSAASMLPQQVCLLSLFSAASCGISFTPTVLRYDATVTTFDVLSSTVSVSAIGNNLGFQLIPGYTKCSGATIASAVSGSITACESLCFATSGCLTYSFGASLGQCLLFSFSAASGGCMVNVGWTSAYLLPVPSAAPPNPDSPFASALVLGAGAYVVGTTVETPLSQSMMLYMQTTAGTDSGAGIAGILATTGPFPCSLTWQPPFAAASATASPASAGGSSGGGGSISNSAASGLSPGVSAVVAIVAIAGVLGGVFFAHRLTLSKAAAAAAAAAAAIAKEKAEFAASVERASLKTPPPIQGWASAPPPEVSYPRPSQPPPGLYGGVGVVVFRSPIAAVASEECPVCMDKKKDMALSPCGHLVCTSCGTNASINLCPICRAVIAVRTHVYT